MDALVAWAIANPSISVPIVLAAVDVVAGWLPDRFTKWPGVILSAANRAYNFGKEAVPVLEQVKIYNREPKAFEEAVEAMLQDPQKVAAIYKALAAYNIERKAAAGGA